MVLSNRLLKIANFVKENTSILDIGTDHGYIPIYLVENNISKKVIASDISEGSLNKTIKLVKDRKLDAYISTRLGYGLDVIVASEIDGVIMAGMGGILMQDILEKDKEVTDSIDYFIFQPMVASKELRKYLSFNNYRIIDEELTKEGQKYYEIIYAERGNENPKKDIYYEISEKLIEKDHPLLLQFVEDKIEQSHIVLEKIKNKSSKKSLQRYKQVIGLIEEYREVMKEIET